MGKVGRCASEEIIIQLVKTKCIPVLLYGQDASSINTRDKCSLDFVLTRCLMKIFRTASIDIVNSCRCIFDVRLIADLINYRKRKFLSKYVQNVNNVCKVFNAAANAELEELNAFLSM